MKIYYLKVIVGDGMYTYEVKASFYELENKSIVFYETKENLNGNSDYVKAVYPADNTIIYKIERNTHTGDKKDNIHIPR